MLHANDIPYARRIMQQGYRAAILSAIKLAFSIQRRRHEYNSIS
jgi:hypothetical protein